MTGEIMNTKRYRLLFFSLLFFLCSFVFAPHPLDAQTASPATEMDTMLAADTVSAAKAARFILASADLLPSDLSGAAAETAAYDIAVSNGWVKKAAEESITLKDTAFLIMKAFDLKGGLMYTLLKNPRYAYREMVYRKLIMGTADPDMKVTGGRLIEILGKTMSYAEEYSGSAGEGGIQ